MTNNIYKIYEINENNNNNDFKFIDLFAGIGGIRIPFQNLGGKCVFSSEIDKYAARTYEANYGEKPSGDITQISANEIPDFDILLAGFPCQAFSIAGKRKGFDDTRINRTKRKESKKTNSKRSSAITRISRPI